MKPRPRPKRSRLSDDGNDEDPEGDESHQQHTHDEAEDRPMTYDALGLGADADAAESEDDFEPCGLTSRRKELKLLGKPGDRKFCFLCSHKGERNAVPCKRADVQRLIDFIRDNHQNMKSTYLAQELAEQYAKIRERVNAARKPHEVALPFMSPASFLDHLRTHLPDAETKQAVQLEELQEARHMLWKLAFQRSRKKKRMRPDKVVFECLSKVYTLELQVQSRPVDKMAFYAAGARMSTNIRNQGPACMANKQLYDFWDSQK